MYELVVCGPSGGGSVRLKFKGILQLSYFDKASLTESLSRHSERLSRCR